MTGQNVKIEILQDVQNALGEGPIWDHREQALYWVDIGGKTAHRYQPSSGRSQTFPFDVAVTVIGLRASGGFVLGTSKGFATWDPKVGSTDFVHDPEADIPESRFNDGAVDRQGRFWAGTYAKKIPTNLYRLDADHSVHRMEEGLTVCNGIGWSIDNHTMYFTDTRIRMIYAYDFDPKSGSINNRRPFVHSPDSEDVPDGLTIDSEGFVWSASFGGWKIVRYDPDGKLEREITLPVKYPTSCTFGGANYRHLFVTSSRAYVPEEDLHDQPHAGAVFKIETDVTGIQNPCFLG
jgi:sugar lactone lactonase YvrE